MAKRLGLIVAIGVLLLLLVFAFGPRVAIDTTLTTPALSGDLDDYLANEEAAFADIVPGAEATIVWAGQPGERTETAFVYLHGFSATRQETAPLSDKIAAAFDANLYYPRLSGHGRDGEALADATVNDWLNDSAEALAIGEQLGRRVVVIGVSTGASLATWLAAQPIGESIAALVLISPNYGPRESASEVLLWPWGGQIANVLVGPQQTWEPHNDAQGRYWTTSYPTGALLPMMGVVKLAREAPLEQIAIPLLVIYSPQDEVVAADRIEETFQRFGSQQKQLFPLESAGDPSNHVLAGDILSPDETGPIADVVITFLEQTLP